MARNNPLKMMASQVAESLDKPTSVPPATSATAPPLAPVTPAEAASVKPTGSKTSREGKRFLGYYVEPLRHEEIKAAADEEGIKLQDLMRIAIDEWMERNGKEAVAIVAARQARRNQRSS